MRDLQTHTFAHMMYHQSQGEGMAIQTTQYLPFTEKVMLEQEQAQVQVFIRTLFKHGILALFRRIGETLSIIEVRWTLRSRSTDLEIKANIKLIIKVQVGTRQLQVL